MKLINCRGQHYRMGEQQGRLLRKMAPGIFRALTTSDFTHPLIYKLGRPGVLKFIFTLLGLFHYRGYYRHVQAGPVHQMERFHGLSETSGLNRAVLLALNHLEMAASSIRYVMGCSSLGIHPARLMKRKFPVLAYNHDFPAFFEQFLILRRSVPKTGLASLALTYPSLAGAIAGVNERGLAVTLNHAFQKDPIRPGVPPTMMVQEVLDTCRSVAQARHMIFSLKSGCGSIITLVDAGGEMAAVEMANAGMALRRPRDGIMLSLNQYEAELLKPFEVPQRAQYDPTVFPPAFHGWAVHAHNWARKKRYGTLLKKRRFRLPDIPRLMSDHDEAGRTGKTTICRHHATADTIASAILLPQEGKMKVLTGHPCRGRYRSYALF